jgi:hypothetical protein
MFYYRHEGLLTGFLTCTDVAGKSVNSSLAVNSSETKGLVRMADTSFGGQTADAACGCEVAGNSKSAAQSQ